MGGIEVKVHSETPRDLVLGHVSGPPASPNLYFLSSSLVVVSIVCVSIHVNFLASFSSFLISYLIFFV